MELEDSPSTPTRAVQPLRVKNSLSFEGERERGEMKSVVVYVYCVGGEEEH